MPNAGVFPNNGAPPNKKAPAGRPRQKLKAKVLYPTMEAAVEALELIHGRSSNVWLYHDAAGNAVAAVIRWDKQNSKEIRQISRHDHQWLIKGLDKPYMLYCLPELLSRSEETVYVCEGEKAADAARSVGLLATTSMQGANSAAYSNWSPLAGRDVVILPDADEAGERYADDVVDQLSKISPAPRVKIVRLPGLPFGTGDDMVDFLAIRDRDVSVVCAEIEELAGALETLEIDGWREFYPLSEPVDSLFPIDALPEVLRRWVEAESESTQTPSALAGLLALSVAAAAAAKFIYVEPWHGWREPVNLFVAVLMGPGNRKSVVFNDATDPLRQREARLRELQRPAIEKALAQRRINEARLRKLEKDASVKNDPEIAREAQELAAKLAEEPAPSLPRLIVDNVTPEKLEMLLAEHNGRLASMSAEGGVFDIMAGRYSDGAASFDVYLKGHSGDELRTDRVGRASVHVENTALTCAYAIQPAVIEGLASKRAFRGRGLLARFLYAMPRSPVGRRVIRPNPVSEHIQRQYCEMISGIGTLSGRRVLRLEHSAQPIFEDWMSEIESMLDVGGRLEHLSDWGGKLGGLTLRLAGILQIVLDRESGFVGPDAMAGAIALSRWSIPHAEAVFNLMRASDTATTDAGHVWRWIQRHEPSEFTARDVWQVLRRSFADRDELDAALNVLVSRGYIRPVMRTSHGPGRPSQRYEVRTALYSRSSTKRSQNSQNCQPKTEKTSFVNSVNSSDIVNFDSSGCVMSELDQLEVSCTGDEQPDVVPFSNDEGNWANLFAKPVRGCRSRKRAAELIRLARGGRPMLAIAMRDAWAERIATCTVDGTVEHEQAEEIALAEIEDLFHQQESSAMVLAKSMIYNGIRQAII